MKFAPGWWIDLSPETLPHILEFHLQDQTEPNLFNFRTEALRNFGITETETIKKDIVGPLDDLKASNLLRGPFNIDIARNHPEHLTFMGPHSHSTLRLLHIDGIFALYCIHRSGLARSSKLNLSLTL